nr:uncharacterized protein LOC115256790 [Aedes albopictus]
MLGRNIKTVLDLLHHDQPKPVVRNHHQDEQFNRKHGAVPREFKKGDEVYAKVYTSNTKWQWASGVIIEVIGRVNHNVLLDDWHGRKKLIRSHSNQLKFRCSEEASIEEDSTPLGILVDMFGLQSKRSPAPEIRQVRPQPEAAANPAADEESEEDEIVSAHSEQADSEVEASQSDSQQDEDDQQPPGSIPEPPSARPQRMIRMPSRFEPYLFWK